MEDHDHNVETGDNQTGVLDWKNGLRTEIKQMRIDIVALKKSVTKGDKKTKKEVQAKVEELEKEMSRKQDIINKGVDPNEANEKVKDASEMSLYLETEKGKKQMKREKKMAQVVAKTEAVRAAKPKLPDCYALEQTKLGDILGREGLEIYDIEPDGHCLFAAVAHQCNLVCETEYRYQDMRRIAADYILDHCEFYAAFLDDDEHKEEENEGLDGYCEKVRSTTLWGGHIELDALAKTLGKTIKVYQAEGEPLTFGETEPENPLRLCFQHYAYSLGEHYDSLVKK